MNEAMTETIPAAEAAEAAETGAQAADDTMTEAIPRLNETGPQDAVFAESAETIWTGPHPAIAESAEIIWSPGVAATTDSGLTSAIAPMSATMVEAAESASANAGLPSARRERVRGRHAAPRPAGTRPAAVGLVKRCEGRHVAARPAGTVARRLAATAGSVAMVAVGLHAVAS